MKPLAAHSFYVYLHRTPTGRVFYVGKGSGRRAWSRKNRNFSWKNTIARHGFVVETVMAGIQEWYALELEIETIARFGLENLVNLTEGGEGLSNPSPETRRKLSNAKLGKKFTLEHRAKLSKAKIGVPKPPRSQQHLENLSKNMPGRALFCSNGRTFPKITAAKDWLRQNGHPKASVGGVYTAAKNQRTAYGFYWKFLNDQTPN